MQVLLGYLHPGCVQLDINIGGLPGQPLRCPPSNVQLWAGARAGKNLSHHQPGLTQQELHPAVDESAISLGGELLLSRSLGALTKALDLHGDVGAGLAR
jgi:hypothetical protein